MQRLVLPKPGEPTTTSVIEIESLAAAATASAGRFGVQQMAGFGPGWGGDAQLFWGAPAPAGDGPRLTLRFELPQAGAYDLILFHTVAPDFGRFTLFLDGSPSSDVDGYHSSVAISRSVLGRHQLAAGAHELALRVTGKNDSSSGYFVGLDRLELSAAAAGTSAPERPAAAPQIAIHTGLLKVLASRPRLEARHKSLKCCPFRTVEGFDTRKVLLDWSSPRPTVSLRWRTEATGAAMGRWEIYGQAPVEYGPAGTPLATGLVRLPAPGEWQSFDVDLTPLRPTSGGRLRRLPAQAPRPELFVRVVPTDAQGQPLGLVSSNTLLLAAVEETAGDATQPSVGPTPSLSLVRYEPIRPYAKDFLCWAVATRDGVGLVGKGQAWYFCQGSSRSAWEMFVSTLGDAAGQFLKSVGSLIDGVSAIYAELKSGVVDVFAGVLAEIGCGDPCRTAVRLALDAALVSVGVPPSLPDFDQALADLEQGGIDALTKVVADAAVSQGVPALAAEEAARQAVTHMVQKAKEAAASGGGSAAKAGDWVPDLSRAYRAGALVLEVRNPFDTPTAVVALALQHQAPKHRAVPGVPRGDGSLNTETVQVGGLRPQFRMIPRLAPGTSLRIELPLEPVPDPHRWLELYHEETLRLGNRSLEQCGKEDPGAYWACGGTPGRSPGDQTERCKQYQQWRNCFHSFAKKIDATRTAAVNLNTAFADVYGPGVETFSLSLPLNRGSLTVDTREGVALVKYPDPTWQGKRVDTCLGSSQQCGEPAAQLFCKLMLYPIAVGGHQAPTLGAQTTTIALDTQQTCTGSHCRAFSDITCSTALVMSAPAVLG